jgi:membrane protease subunit HflK
MLTADANIVDIDVEVQWNIADADKYLFNIKEQIDTLKKSAESALREVVGQTNLQPIITQGRTEVAERIRERLQKMMDDYGSGIAIKEVLIQDATVHPDVTAAFEDVVAALQDAEKFQNEATIYRNDIIPKARGEAIKMLQEAEAYKQSQIAKATGDAKRFDEVYQAYVRGKDVTKERIYIETMEDIYRKAQKVIVDQENGSTGVLPYLPLNNNQMPSSPTIRRNLSNGR